MIDQVEIKYMVSRRNLYHVPAKQWNKWGVVARQVFNEMYSSMNGNQGIFTHPKQEKMPKEQWGTIAWNAAWTAAGATNDIL